MKRISTLVLAALVSLTVAVASAQSNGPAPAAPASASPATPVPAAMPKPAIPVATAPAAIAMSAGEGTLVVDAKAFTSEIPLDKKVEDQLRGAGIEWGVKDGLFVQTGVNKQFVNFDISNLTRYGQNKSVAVPAGDYSITCIGMIPHTAFSVQSILNKSAYVNENIIHFHVDAGKTTTLTIQPIMMKNETFFLTFYIPQLMTSVTTEAGTTSPVSINAKTSASIAWPDYKGPLKF